MSIKKILFFTGILALAAGPAFSQVLHDNDDRDLFIGVGDNSTIRPNIMILADNSGSMNSAIYHVMYDPKIDYTKDSSGTALDLNVDNEVFAFDDGASYSYVGSMKTFNICRGISTSTPAWDARGRFYGLYKNDPSRWIVYKNTVSGTFPVIGQVIDYDGAGSGINDTATITDIVNKNTYWIITVAGYNGTPTANAYLYINYHLQTVLNNSLAQFIPVGETCVGFDQTFTNVKLFGTADDDGNQTRYDRNYLYWLAFFASASQINEVTYWATTGFLPDKKGTLVDAGYYRMDVLRRVLADVMREVHGDVNLGLACFNPPGSGNHGGYIRENLTNFNTLESLDSMIKNNIENLLADTNTPLAETLADVWYYMIGQNTSTLQPHTDASVASDCPIKFKCQKNYVIIMTDGQSTYDEFTGDSATRFTGSYFKNNPIATWGDADSHDPVAGVQPINLTKPDGTAYCPNYSCWGLNGNNGSHGTDYLDDVAYYMHNTDHFPDAIFQPALPDNGSPAWQVYHERYEDAQTIETYVIGFNQDNDMLAETAKNGDGVYYTAQSYDQLKTALTNAIVNIQLRNMAFAAFTAPKKITSTVGEGFSFVGYFMPDAVSAIWTGHLQSFRMTDKWFADTDSSRELEKDNAFHDNEFENQHYDFQGLCETANSPLKCLRSLELNPVPGWDVQRKIVDMTSDRRLFTHDSATAVKTLIPFTLANAATLQELFVLPADPDPLVQAQNIITKISSKVFGDVFHSDIAYVGPPLPGKKYVKNLNPSECDAVPKDGDRDCFEYLLKQKGATPGDDNSGRPKVLYVGTNDGVLHQINATTDEALGGTERWGFIPDEVLPNLKKIVVDNKYTYTVDGRLLAEDIYYRGTENDWKTILVFGLKDGGNAFYSLDITNVAADDTPVVLWKFVDEDYSGKSWSKPFVGKIRYPKGTSWEDRWVVVLAGGMAFNNENKASMAGKAIFVVDASSGDLIWMIGYKPTGVDDPGIADAAGTVEIDTVKDSSVTTGLRYLTAKDDFNYPIPTAITPIDRDSDGYLDTIYFGNVAGHLFKTDISAIDTAQWKTYQLYKKADNLIPSVMDAVGSPAPVGNTVNLGSTAGFAIHQNVFGVTSKAMATVDDVVSNKILTVGYLPDSPSFIEGETIVVPTFDPVFLSPAVAFDPCYNLWVTFGTGDRVRSRTNPDSGKFIAIRDGTTVVSSSTVQKTDITSSDLVNLTWSGTTMNETNIKVSNKWGWQFTFPMYSNHEKLFDPEPIILPDLNMVPHIYFNTYQPSQEGNNDCDAPKNGLMYFYDLKMDYCGSGNMSGDYESGRIAGGGVFQGTDYIVYQGIGDVASIPPLQAIKPIKLIYTGGLLFWKEKKR